MLWITIVLLFFVEQVSPSEHLFISGIRSLSIESEPKGPVVKTTVPGPRSKQLLDELNSLQVSNW